MQDYREERIHPEPGTWEPSWRVSALPPARPLYSSTGSESWSLDQHHLGTQEEGKLSVPPQTYSVRIWGMGFPAISIFMCGLSLRIQPNEKIKYGHKYLCIITKMFISLLFI